MERDSQATLKEAKRKRGRLVLVYGRAQDGHLSLEGERCAFVNPSIHHTDPPFRSPTESQALREGRK